VLTVPKDVFCHHRITGEVNSNGLGLLMGNLGVEPFSKTQSVPASVSNSASPTVSASLALADSWPSLNVLWGPSHRLGFRQKAPPVRPTTNPMTASTAHEKNWHERNEMNDPASEKRVGLRDNADLLRETADYS